LYEFFSFFFNQKSHIEVILHNMESLYICTMIFFVCVLRLSSLNSQGMLTSMMMIFRFFYHLIKSSVVVYSAFAVLKSDRGMK